MDQVTNTRNEFILGISLSELAFLYFMLLLLIALFMVKDHINELNKKEETIKDQKELLIAMKREDFDPKTWLIDIKKLKEGNYALKEEIDKLKKSAITDDELEKYSKISSEFDLDGLDDKKFEEYSLKQNTNNKNNILKTYDLLLNNKYNVVMNQKTIERVKNFFQ